MAQDLEGIMTVHVNDARQVTFIFQKQKGDKLQEQTRESERYLTRYMPTPRSERIHPYNELLHALARVHRAIQGYAYYDPKKRYAVDIKECKRELAVRTDMLRLQQAFMANLTVEQYRAFLEPFADPWDNLGFERMCNLMDKNPYPLDLSQKRVAPKSKILSVSNPMDRQGCRGYVHEIEYQKRIGANPPLHVIVMPSDTSSGTDDSYWPWEYPSLEEKQKRTRVVTASALPRVFKRIEAGRGIGLMERGVVLGIKNPRRKIWLEEIEKRKGGQSVASS